MNNMNDMNMRKRSYEAHAMEQAPHAYPGSLVAPPTPYQWHEMDYTSPAMDASRFGPTSAPVQYPPPGMVSYSPVDYTRQDYVFGPAYHDADNSASSLQMPGLYRVGPFRYADLANIDGDAASVSQDSIYSRSTRLHSLTDSERRDSQTNSILSSHDVRRESEGFDRVFPMTSIDPETCSGDPCGPDPSALDSANLAPIEECTSAPCMTISPQFIAPKPMSIPNQTIDEDSPVRATQSAFSSPTALTFADSVSTEHSKLFKSRRTPRSKSASAATGENPAMEKASKLRARQAHSLVERKYRDNLNLKISQLHQTLQTARFGPATSSKSPPKELKSDYFDDETVLSLDIPNERTSAGSTPTGSKVRKSDVLTEAMNYVNSTEMEMVRMSDEIMKLTAQVKTLERLVRCEDCNLLKKMVTLDVESQQQAARPNS